MPKRKVTKPPRVPKWLKRKSPNASRALIGLTKRFTAVFEGRNVAVDKYYVVAEMLRKFPPIQKRVAISALGKVLLLHPNKNIRQMAGFCLVSSISYSGQGRRTGLKALKKSALTDRDVIVRLTSFQKVIDIEKTTDVNFLDRVIMKDKSEYVRRWAIDKVARSDEIPQRVIISFLKAALETEKHLGVKTFIEAHIKAIKAGTKLTVVINAINAAADGKIIGKGISYGGKKMVIDSLLSGGPNAIDFSSPKKPKRKK